MPGRWRRSAATRSSIASTFRNCAASTGPPPYFHDHRAKTLEEVVKHYQSFFFFINTVRGLPLPLIADEDIRPDRGLYEESAVIMPGSGDLASFRSSSSEG